MITMADFGRRPKKPCLDLEDKLVQLLDETEAKETRKPKSSDEYMDNDWFNSLFEDPVLNDKMITDAAQPPRIQSEHSYSINDNSVPSSPLGLGKLEDLDTEFFVNNQALDLTNKAVNSITENVNSLDQSRDSKINIGLESIDPTLTTITTMTTRSLTNKQPSIILATSSTQQPSSQQPSYQITQTNTHCSSPIVTIKTEPRDYYSDSIEPTVHVDSLILPPTPPGSSSSSDSEGSQSPQRSAPSSPIRQLPITRHYTSTSPSSHKPYSQPLFTNPIPQSGVLILTEEEKRTLISEGYPVPTKLPLTKQEEKNLKKIRRKIKNKISAQESRRKKKEYLEALEKRVEAYSQENNDLKKKMETLESSNRSLVGQLQKLQALVGKVTRPAGGSTQTGTVLMVLVLCFAIFLGSWSPSSLNIGYSYGHAPVDGASFFANPRLMNPSPMIGPSVQNAKVDAYTTPNMKSRVLLSMRDDLEETMCHQPYGPQTPKGMREVLEQDASLEVINKTEAMPAMGPKTTEASTSPQPSESKVIKVVTIVTGHDNKTIASRDLEQSVMHPDISVNTDLMNSKVEKRVETETS
ncbi:hypothetical protein FSP39_011872 [Pinctada imbricata]|uniref:BZIP domain-containing protein n=1 Tax=Pinctada imbricata TaxID=66713 RepID=A0AA89C0K3_PINIB|nr:hypothetical protein FSP39_011872 [Pinctada imbricata]